MRQIAFDTETTGFYVEQGDRVLEIGCVEIIDREVTGRTWHTYINPQRDSDPGALAVHGLTTEFLSDKPLFADVAQEFIDFIAGAEIIAHNASFDVTFLDYELKQTKQGFSKLENYCVIVDTLAMAKQKYPGSASSLDALCRRFQVDNSGRELHGALIDADLLAQVYLLMTGGQTGLEFDGNGGFGGQHGAEPIRPIIGNLTLATIQATVEELAEHQQYLLSLNKKSGKNYQW